LARVQKLSSQILETGNLAPPPEDDGASKLTDYTTVGTISTGSSEASSSVNKKDVYLRELYVKPEHLDLAELSDLALFRGQVVAVVGSNPHQRRLIAHSIHSIALPRPQIFEDARIRVRSRELHMMVAAGPFTTKEDLSYEPLTELLRQVKLRQPSVLVLMGPFVDEKHPLIASGQSNTSFSQLFQSVMQKIQLAVEAFPFVCKVCVLPALSDVTHRNILPQPSFPSENRLGALPSNFLRAPNPSVIRVNELDLGFVSLDVLKHLEQNSIISGPNANDKPSSLVSFILHQQSFFPIFPPPIDVHVDMNHAEEGLTISEMPDALFFASSLHPFVRIINGVLAINVGNLINGGSPGSYAEIKVSQVPANSNASIVQRANVEIIRI
jgi:DNA polymerase alpha subunit B